MLSPQLLELLRAWWREGRHLGVLLPRGWLFPGRNPVEPLSTRQLNRAVHTAAEAAGIKKRVSPHTPGSQPGVRHATCWNRTSISASSRACPGAGRGAARSCQTRHHRPLHPRRQYDDPHRDQAARPARAADPSEATNRGVVRRLWAAQGSRSQTSSIAMEPPGAEPILDTSALDSSR